MTTAHSPKNGDCIFCKIISGEIPCAKLYETDEYLSFLDISPVNKGHALVLPKGHFTTLWDMPGELGNGLLAAAQKVGQAILKATGADGLNLWMNNHEAAGQLVPHAHFHLIPRFAGDGLELWDQSAYADQDEMSKIADMIRRRID